MPAYDANFLGIALPLPKFSPARVADILPATPLMPGGLATYPNYAVTIDKRYRAPAFTALHIDQTKLRTTERASSWKIDSRVGAEWQLDDTYFKDTPWDKGHMADRESAAWGTDLPEAQAAADETFYYTNATLQHRNHNQDEWRGIEEGILKLPMVKAGRLTVFSGPVFGANPRIITPPGRRQAEVPAGFFKVVCFVNANDNKFEVRAFLAFQDAEALQDLRGRRVYNYTHYQVTITEIERVTELKFPAQVYERNPLYYHENPAEGARLNIRSFPERVDINQPQDIIHHDTPRVPVADDEVEVYLSAALVKPAGGPEGEWVSLANYETKTVDVTGWKLVDRAGHTLVLGGTIKPGGTLILRGAKLRPVTLPDTGGLLTLLTAAGERIDRADYTAKDVKASLRPGRRENLPLNFQNYRSNLRP